MQGGAEASTGDSNHRHGCLAHEGFGLCGAPRTCEGAAVDAVRQRDGGQGVVQRDQGAPHALALALAPAQCGALHPATQAIHPAIRAVLLQQGQHLTRPLRCCCNCNMPFVLAPMPNASEKGSNERALGRLTSSSVSAAA